MTNTNQGPMANAMPSDYHRTTRHLTGSEFHRLLHRYDLAPETREWIETEEWRDADENWSPGALPHGQPRAHLRARAALLQRLRRARRAPRRDLPSLRGRGALLGHDISPLRVLTTTSGDGKIDSVRRTT